MLSLMTDQYFMEVGVYSLLSVFPLPGLKMYMIVFGPLKAVRITMRSTSSPTIVTDSALVDSSVSVATINVSASSVACFRVEPSLINQVMSTVISQFLFLSLESNSNCPTDYAQGIFSSLVIG